MMIKYFDESFQMNHNSHWSYISHHPYKNLIIGGLVSGQTNVLLNLIKHQRPNLFICQRSIQIKVLTIYESKKKSRD